MKVRTDRGFSTLTKTGFLFATLSLALTTKFSTSLNLSIEELIEIQYSNGFEASTEELFSICSSAKGPVEGTNIEGESWFNDEPISSLNPKVCILSIFKIKR